MDVHLFKPMYSSGIQFFKDSTFLFEYGAYMNEPITKGTYRYIGEKKFVLNSNYNNTLLFNVAKEKIDTAISIVYVNFTSDLPMEMFKEFYTLINDTLIGYHIPEKEFYGYGATKIKFEIRLKNEVIGTKNIAFISQEIHVKNGYAYSLSYHFTRELMFMHLFNNDTIRVNNSKLTFNADSRSFTSFEFSKINSINRVKSLFRLKD